MNLKKIFPLFFLMILASSALPGLTHNAEAYVVYGHPGYWHNSGRWYHGWHDGRIGWWWVAAAGGWYAYNRPIYYTAPPQTVIVEQPVAAPQVMPPAAPIQPAPQVVTAAPAPPMAPPGYPKEAWYYCSNPAGYFPNVSNCPQGWIPVPTSRN